jgi:hypothetical protein
MRPLNMILARVSMLLSSKTIKLSTAKDKRLR